MNAESFSPHGVLLNKLIWLFVMLDSNFARRASYLLQRKIVSPRPRAHISAVVAAMRPKMSGEMSALETTGLQPLQAGLSLGQIEEILAFLGNGPLHDPYRHVSGFHTETVPPGSRLGYYERSQVIRAPHLLALANRADLLANAAAALGAKPTISDLLVWWSFPTGEPARDSQMWHRDCSDWTMVKAFFYMSDVDHDSGPHAYALNSFNDNRMTEVGRQSDEAIATAYPDRVVLTDRAGSGFMSNPRGFHRATVPRMKRRLMFEATYSLMGMRDSDYSGDLKKLYLMRSEFGALDPWINRFFVTAKD